MDVFIKALILLIALLHVAFLVLEMFYWTKPIGLSIFRQSIAKAQSSAVLAANQGLYNGFLAGGLIWGLLHPSPEFGLQIVGFVLSCIFIAGIYGAYSVNRRILFVQALPAAIALGLLAVG